MPHGFYVVVLLKKTLHLNYVHCVRFFGFLYIFSLIHFYTKIFIHFATYTVLYKIRFCPNFIGFVRCRHHKRMRFADKHVQNAFGKISTLRT